LMSINTPSRHRYNHLPQYMIRLNYTDGIVIVIGLIYLITFFLRDQLNHIILVNSIPSFTGAIVFSSLFKRKFSKLPQGRLYQYTYCICILIIMVLEEFSQINRKYDTYDFNDLVGIVLGIFLSIFLFEMERKQMFER
jgi:hypothetical protein